MIFSSPGIFFILPCKHALYKPHSAFMNTSRKFLTANLVRIVEFTVSLGSTVLNFWISRTHIPAMDRSLRAKAAMEMVGTGILLSVISMAAVADSEKAPLAVVALLVGLIYMGFELSGAHYNPAVTLTFFLRNRFSPQASLLYILAQFSGALCGALFATFITGHTVSLKIAPAYSLANALFAELFFTAILCFSILTITLRSNSELHPIFGSTLYYVFLFIPFFSCFVFVMYTCGSFFCESNIL